MSIFGNALYTMSIGGNDFTYGYTKGQTPAQVEQYLPQVVSGITNAIQVSQASDLAPRISLESLITRKERI
jgi:hypothetical protein